MKMTKTLAAFSAVIMALSAASLLNHSVYAGEDLQSYADEVVTLVNAERVSAGLQPLEAVPVLNDVATLRSQEITRSFSHTRPNGKSCSTALDDYGVTWRTSGENIAYGYDSPESVMNGWMNSQGHRENILNSNFEYIGVGVVEYGGLLYWTQTFTGGSDFDNAYTPETVTTSPETAKPAETIVPCVGENCNPVTNPSCANGNCTPFIFNPSCQNGTCQNGTFAQIPDCLKNAGICFTLPSCGTNAVLGNSSGQCPLGQLAGLLTNCR